MEPSPWELLNSSRIAQHFTEPEGSLPCSQEPATVPILSQMNPVHTTPSYFSKIHLNIIFPPTSRYFYWSRSFWLSHQNPICISLRPMHATCPAHITRLDSIILVILGEDTSWLSPQTRVRGQAVTLLISTQEITGSNLGQSAYYSYYPLSLCANAGICLNLGHSRFLPHAFQFLVHYRPVVWFCKSQLLTASSESGCDRRSVGQSVFPSGAHDQILITVWQLLFCRCRAPPLTRGRVCHFP
jgi:hypothetical protein